MGRHELPVGGRGKSHAASAAWSPEGGMGCRVINAPIQAWIESFAHRHSSIGDPDSGLQFGGRAGGASSVLSLDRSSVSSCRKSLPHVPSSQSLSRQPKAEQRTRFDRLFRHLLGPCPFLRDSFASLLLPSIPPQNCHPGHVCADRQYESSCSPVRIGRAGVPPRYPHVVTGGRNSVGIHAGLDSC
jgi:hypothetical protein